MGRKFYTRLNIDDILKTNTLDAMVSYMDRENVTTPDSVIVYDRLSPTDSFYADDKVHLRKALVQITHFKKRKLENIADLVLENFNIEPSAFNVKQLDDDYWADYYTFEVITDGNW